MLQSIVDQVTNTDDHDQPTDATTTLSQDDIHEILANERRRWLLDQLASRSWTLSTLAVERAAQENTKPVNEVDSQERKRCYVAFYQAHLPELDGLGVVNWDQNGGRIHKGPEYDGVRAVQIASQQHVTDTNDEEVDG